jgi:hypothetical protein
VQPAAGHPPAPETAPVTDRGKISVSVVARAPVTFDRRCVMANASVTSPRALSRRAGITESLAVALLPLHVMAGAGPPSTPCSAGRGKGVDGGPPACAGAWFATMTGLVSRVSLEAVIPEPAPSRAGFSPLCRMRGVMVVKVLQPGQAGFRCHQRQAGERRQKGTGRGHVPLGAAAPILPATGCRNPG